MSIVHGESDERQTDVARMIDEFRTARSRRLATATTVKDDHQAVESQRDALAQAAVAGSTPTYFTLE